MFKRIAAIVLAVMLTGCAAHVGGRDNYRELVVAQRWAYAQYLLAEKTNGKSYEIPYSIYKWKFGKGLVRFDMEDGSYVWVKGYFDPINQEIYVSLHFVPGMVIEHEACHAILFALSSHEYVSYCHDPDRPWYQLRGTPID